MTENRIFVEAKLIIRSAKIIFTAKIIFEKSRCVFYYKIKEQCHTLQIESQFHRHGPTERFHILVNYSVADNFLLEPD